MIRLVLLYPLAVSGCEGMNGGTFGCEAPLFQFHNFILEYGSLLVLVIGWTIWFNITGARNDVRNFWKRLPQLNGLSCDPSLDDLNSSPVRAGGVYFSLGMGLPSIFSYISKILGDTSSVDACANTISASCTRIVTEYEDSLGVSFRLLLISIVIFLMAWLRPKLNWLTEEE